jgi:von Willebrand factor A domain-containing protein 5
MNAVRGEYIFLLDRSGSMGGSRIKKAVEALCMFLKSLPEDTYFNVISFGYGSKLLHNSSIKYSDKTLKGSI